MNLTLLQRLERSPQFSRSKRVTYRNKELFKINGLHSHKFNFERAASYGTRRASTASPALKLRFDWNENYFGQFFQPGPLLPFEKVVGRRVFEVFFKDLYHALGKFSVINIETRLIV